MFYFFFLFMFYVLFSYFFFFFQAEDGIRDIGVTGVQTCALPIFRLVSMILCQSSSEWPQTGCSAVVPAALTRMPAGPHTASAVAMNLAIAWSPRSEERRVGKECRSRWWPGQSKKKRRNII